MKTSSTLELLLARMSLGGDALGSLNGKKIFAPLGVPKDKVLIKLTEERKDFARGQIVQILEKSPHRTDPFCPLFYRCGGCQWQHIRYDSQLEFKTALLQEALERIGKIQSPRLLDPLASPQTTHYRNRIRLQVSRQGEVGFFRAHSKEVIPVERCPIADERLNEKIPEAKQIALRMLEQDRLSRPGIEIRLEGESAVIRSEPEEEGSFQQVNSAQNANLIQRVLQALKLQGNEAVLELFAGEGNFTFPMAKQSQSVTAVELSSASIQKAEKKSQNLRIKNIEWIEASGYRALQMLQDRKGLFQRVLLDPPRKGALEVLQGIRDLGIPEIVYVSCDPATLARDAKQLTALGYEHQFSQAIDMFPHTYHVESVTKLVLK